MPTNSEGVKRENMDGLGCDWCGARPAPEAGRSVSGVEWTWDRLIADRGERVCQRCRADYDARVARATREMPLIISDRRYRAPHKLSYSYGICECGGQVAGHPRDDHWAAAYDYLVRD